MEEQKTMEQEAVDAVPEQEKNGGEGTGTEETGKNVDTEKAQEIADKRKERAERSAVTSYFRQQGLSPEEAEEAFKDFKAKRKEQEIANRNNLQALQAKVDSYEKADSEAMRVANRRLIRAEAMITAQRLNIRPDRIQHAIRLADLSHVDVGEDGNVDDQALQEALETVVKEIPELLNSTGEENKPGFKLGGSGGQKTNNNNRIAEIFGNKKGE